jgi:hypothetical protein
MSALSAEDAAAAFGAILDALSRVISPTLIDAAGWLRLRAAVGGLPVDPGIGFGFELRLGDPAAGSDFYLAVPRRSRLAEYYVRRGERDAHSAVVHLGAHLAAIDTAAPWAEDIGVEFDATSGSRAGPPGLFVRVRPELANDDATGSPSARTVAEWVAGAAGWTLSDKEKGALDETCGALVAAGAAVDCVGAMPGRADRALRVVSRTLPPAAVLPVLERLRWRGPAGEIATFLSTTEGLFRALRLALAVTAAGIAPRVGFELFQGEPGTLRYAGAGSWGPFLARLCEAGMCRPDKADALLAWPGREFVFRGGDTFGVLTGLHHVKVSFDSEPGATVEAKAYPAAGYRTFDTIRARFGAQNEPPAS